MFNRIRKAADQITQTGGSVEDTAKLVSALIIELMDNGVEFYIKVGDKELPISLRIHLPQNTE